MTVPSWKYEAVAKDGILTVTNAITKESRKATYTMDDIEKKTELLINEMEGNDYD